MAQFAQPSGDISVGYWSNQAGQITNLYASVNDPLANDADYVQSASVPVDDYLKFMLSSLSAPSAGNVILRVRARWGSQALPTIETAFFWDAVPSATNYHLQVGTRPGVYNVFNGSVGGVLTYFLNLVPGRYYSRMLAYDSGTLIYTGNEEQVDVA